MDVIAEGIPRGCQGESSNPRVLGIPNQFTIKTLLSNGTGKKN